MSFDPGGEIVRVAGFKGEFREVEPCCRRGGVVTTGAVLLKERVRAGERWSSGHGGNAQESGGDDPGREGSAAARWHPNSI